MEIIAWRDLSSFKQTVTLDGTAYILWAKWNTLYQFWTLDILAIDNTPILQGLKLVVGIELIGRFQDARLPGGKLLVAGIRGNVTRIGREDMGVETQLVYFSKAEVAALA